MEESTEQLSLDALRKENKELKSELRWRDQNRKAWDFMQSIIIGIFVYWMVIVICALADIGLATMAESGAYTELGMALWHIFYALAKTIVICYIIYHVIVVNIWRFQDKIRIAAEKLRVYVKAGREAVAKNREKIEEDVLKGKAECNTVQKQL